MMFKKYITQKHELKRQERTFAKSKMLDSITSMRKKITAVTGAMCSFIV